MRIEEDGIDEKQKTPFNKVNCPFCDCLFEFRENDIEEVIERIPYDKGIKKFLGMTKDFILHKYITCPWCKNKLRLRYIAEDIYKMEIKIWND